MTGVPLNVVLITICFLSSIRSMPLNSNSSNQGRLYFDAVGNWIMDTEWLPIEVNVPDTISGMFSGIQNAWTSTMGYFGISPPPRIRKTNNKSMKLTHFLASL